MLAQSYIVHVSRPGEEDLLAIPGQAALIYKRGKFGMGAHTHLSLYNSQYSVDTTQLSGYTQYKWYAANFRGPITMAAAQTYPAAKAGNGCGHFKYTFSGVTPGFHIERARSGFVSPRDTRGILMRQFINLHVNARQSDTAMGHGQTNNALGQCEVEKWRPVIVAEVPDTCTKPTVQLYDIVEKRMINALVTPIPFLFSPVTKIPELKKLGLDGIQSAMEDWYYNTNAYMASIGAENLYVWHQEDAGMLLHIEEQVSQDKVYTVSEAKQLHMNAVPGVTYGSIADPNRSSIFRWVSTPGDRNDVLKHLDLEAHYTMLEALGSGVFRDPEADSFLA